MKKTTSLNLPNRLTQYSALSLAIAGVVGVNGEVIYTDIADTGPNWTYNLDIDGGGTNDFYLRHWLSSYGLFGVLDVLPENGNAIIGRYTSIDIFPFALNNSYAISAGNTYWQSNYQYQNLNFLSCNPASNSYWCGVTNKFLGLRFDIGGNTHYGWARLDVNASGSTWLLKDYAYDDTPGASIIAGDGILGIDDELVSKVKVVALNKNIALYNLPESTSYKLFNMTGQTVLNDKIENDTFVIEANTLASGIYIIELENNTTKAILRKKIVL